MDSILYQIFSGEYDSTPEPDKTKQEIRARIFAETDQIQAVLGDEFLDRLFSLEGERANRENFRYYRSGFALGVRLMLEVLR